MRSYEIGLSALRTHQTTMQVIGNNIANASTPGYHRQSVNLVTRQPEFVGAHLLGTGVEIGGISRAVDVGTQEALLRNNAMLGLVDEELATASGIESLFATGTGSIHALYSEFFNNLESVANSPEVDTIRDALVASGENLLYQFDTIRESLHQATTSRIAEVEAAAEDINVAVSEIAALNQKILVQQGHGGNTGELLDRRDALVSRLAELTDVSIHRDLGGRDIVSIGGGVVSIGNVGVELTARDGSQGWGLYLGQSDQPLQLNTGRVQGLLTAINETIPNVLDRLETLAAQIVQSVDQQHAGGITADGAFSILRGVRGVNRVDVPLVRAGTPFSLLEGELTLSITDTATGTRSSHRIAVDPYVDTVTDLVGRIDAIDGVSAYVNETTGRVTIAAGGAREIDFAGRVDNVPDLTSYTGSGTPVFSGRYLGSANDELTATFNTSGTIGLTDGLVATFADSNGQIVGTVELGPEYEAGTDVVVGDGVSVRFENGTVAATDTASVLLTANPDTSGVLAALGINSLFQGSEIGTYAIRKDIRTNPDLLAISTSGFPGEAGNIARIANLRDIRFESLEDRTFIEELADFTAQTGLESQQAASQKEQLESYGRRLEEQNAIESGVNTDEEFLHLLEVERAYQAIARFISTVDETLNEMFRILQ